MEEQLLQQLKESVDKLQPYLEVMSANTSPAPYTIWNLTVSIFAAIFGAIGAYYGWRAYYYSKRISNNVARMTADNQLELIIDLFERFQNSFVYFLSCQLRDMRQGGFTPAKSLLLRLRLPSYEDYFNLRDYNGNRRIYESMVNLKQYMNSYNAEVDLAISSSELIMEVRCKLLYNPLRMIRTATEMGSEVLNRMSYMEKRFKYKGQWAKSIGDKEYFKIVMLQKLFSRHVRHVRDNLNQSHNTTGGLCNILTVPVEWGEKASVYNAVYEGFKSLKVDAITIETLCSGISQERITQYKDAIVQLFGKSKDPLAAEYVKKLGNGNAVIDEDFLLTMMCIDAVFEDKNMY